MERSRFRVLTKGVGSHVIVDRTTGRTIGMYADGQKAWTQARNLNSCDVTHPGKLEKLMR